MTTFRNKIITSDYRIVGLLTTGASILLLSIVFLLTNISIIAKDNFVIYPIMTFITLSPLLAIILTGFKLRFQNTTTDTFKSWVRKSFINFLLTTFMLSLVGLLITKQNDIIKQLVFDRIYLIIFIPLIGLTFSVISTLTLRRYS
jgi:hypothetical protein